MKLLDEIIDLAAGDEGSVATLLRKCLVLAYRLKNDRLILWAEKELNGYEQTDEVPEYRSTVATAKGFFVGRFGAQIENQPIPPALLKQEHRRFADSVALRQPIASYEGVTLGKRFVIEWPADLTLLYQASFFEGYVLNRAWQEVPASVFVGLVDTIRTRVLRFALELKDDLRLVSEDLNELPKGKIDQSITAYIFGGTNVIASRDFTQIDSINIEKGDWTALAEALAKRLGVDKSALSELKSALDDESKAGTATGLGQRTVTWLKQIGSKVGPMALSFGVEVAKKEATKWIFEYLGLNS